MLQTSMMFFSRNVKVKCNTISNLMEKGYDDIAALVFLSYFIMFSQVYKDVLACVCVGFLQLYITSDNILD